MPLRQLWGGYLRQLERRPIVVKALSSATTFSLTDILAQGRERHIAAPGEAATYDPVRTVRNGLFGLLWLGPTNHVFWGRSVLGLEHWFPGSAWRMVLSRVVVDQMTAMPANMLVFLAWQPLLRCARQLTCDSLPLPTECLLSITLHFINSCIATTRRDMAMAAGRVLGRLTGG
jgi:hypothetical protein